MRRTMVLALLGALAAASSAYGEEIARPESHPSCDRGPIRIRNQFPLSLHFLSFPGEDAQPVGRGRTLFALDITTANTFVQSDDLLRNGDSARSSLTSEEFERLLAAQPQRQQFLFDGEVTRASFLIRRGISDRAELQIEIPYIHLGGGFLDGAIEGFHESFGLDNAARSGYARDKLQIALYLDPEQRLFKSFKETSGLGDSVVSMKFLLLRETGRLPAAALRIAVKPPTGGSRSLLSSGHVDYGANLALAKHYPRQAFYLNLGYVISGGWWALPNLELADVRTILFAYEHALGPRRSLIVQDLIHSSFFAQATKSGLAEISHEVTVGIKTTTRTNIDWTIAITENYATYTSSPDVGVHVGFACTL